MSKILLTSDWHFSHRGICKGTSIWTESIPPRNFSSIEEMNSTILDNLNSVVGQNDILYNLGDVIFGTLRDIPEILDKIRCKNIHLIYGNHDKKLIKQKWFQSYFRSIQPYLELKYNKEKIVLCHYPFLTWNRSRHGSISCHGHCHGNLPDLGVRRFDVGVDVTNYKPILIDELIEKALIRPINLADIKNS